jgi:hypothetical protein
VGHVAHVDEDKFIRDFGREIRMQRPGRQCQRKGGGEAGTNYRGPTFPKGAKGPWPDCAAYVFVLLGVIIICPLANSNPFRTSPSHCTDS